MINQLLQLVKQSLKDDKKPLYLDNSRLFSDRSNSFDGIMTGNHERIILKKNMFIKIYRDT